MVWYRTVMPSLSNPAEPNVANSKCRSAPVTVTLIFDFPIRKCCYQLQIQEGGGQLHPILSYYDRPFCTYSPEWDKRTPPPAPKRESRITVVPQTTVWITYTRQIENQQVPCSLDRHRGHNFALPTLHVEFNKTLRCSCIVWLCLMCVTCFFYSIILGLFLIQFLTSICVFHLWRSYYVSTWVWHVVFFNKLMMMMMNNCQPFTALCVAMGGRKIKKKLFKPNVPCN